MPFDGWGTSGAWYYLEIFFNQQLVSNTSYGVNHTPIEKFPLIIYMICDHRFESELIQTECVDRFVKSYPMIDGELEILSQGSNLSLWSASVKLQNQKQVRNVVHEELLND